MDLVPRRAPDTPAFQFRGALADLQQENGRQPAFSGRTRYFFQGLTRVATSRSESKSTLAKSFGKTFSPLPFAPSCGCLPSVCSRRVRQNTVFRSTKLLPTALNEGPGRPPWPFTTPRPSDYLTSIGISFGLASSFFGISITSTPSLYEAFTLVGSMLAGSVKLRWKTP